MSASQLVRKLLKVNTSLLSSSQHTDIEQGIKLPTAVPAAVQSLTRSVSQYSLSILGKEHRHATANAANVQFQVKCSC